MINITTLKNYSIKFYFHYFIILFFFLTVPINLNAKNLQQLNLLIDYLESLFPSSQIGKVVDYSIPKFIGSKPFRTGRLYPFLFLCELYSLEGLFELIYKLYAFQEVDMWIFPANDHAIEIWEQIENVDDGKYKSIYKTSINLFLYEGEPEAGFDSYSLWERPFKITLYLFDESYVLHFINKADDFKKLGFKLELAKEFECNQTNFIHYSGKEYIKVVYNMFVVPQEPFIHQRRERTIWYPENFFDKDGSSPWSLKGSLFGALESVLDEPRFYKGWLMSKEKIKSKVWFESVTSATYKNGFIMKIVGKANDIEELVNFLRKTKNSGWFNKVSIKNHNVYYSIKLERFIVDFEMDCYF